MRNYARATIIIICSRYYKYNSSYNGNQSVTGFFFNRKNPENQLEYVKGKL